MRSMVQTRGYADRLGDSSPGVSWDHVVPRPPSPVAGSGPTPAGAEPAVSRVLTPNPCHLRQLVGVGARMLTSPDTEDPRAALFRSCHLDL